jgi:hypothetical protein
MSDEQLTSELAVRAMRWRLAPGRFLKPDGGWTSRSGFRPLVDIGDALKALQAVTHDYSLVAKPSGGITVDVRLPERTGHAAGKSTARTVSLALAQALGIETEAGQ